MAWKPGNTPNDAGKWLNDTGGKIIINVQSEITKKVRELSRQMQNQLNEEIKGGPVAFTKRAIFFNFIQSGDLRTNQIIVRGDQAAYLRSVLNPDEANDLYDKIIPTSSARLTKQGNISTLNKGLASKKLIVVEEKGKKYLIDSTKKKKQRSKRVIGVKEKKKRKMVYDFFKNAEDGAKLLLSDINGTYKFTKRIN
ncbi:hypothetical protein ACO1ZG_21780 [Enterobacter kobei]|uniref:hypothetical protein n=1 Tax=Enterobacter kobei TaxID=208224 RepID=UPI003B8714E0